MWTKSTELAKEEVLSILNAHNVSVEVKEEVTFMLNSMYENQRGFFVFPKGKPELVVLLKLTWEQWWKRRKSGKYEIVPDDWVVEKSIREHYKQVVAERQQQKNMPKG